MSHLLGGYQILVARQVCDSTVDVGCYKHEGRFLGKKGL